MALRMIEVVLPAAEADTLRDLVAFEPRAGPWRQEIEVTARLVRVGNSSMRIHVETYGECLERGTRRHCTGADFVFVAVDNEGRPRPIPGEAREKIGAEPTDEC